MENTPVLIIGVLLILAMISFEFDSVFALDYKKHVTLEDLGVLQLAAHDLFNVNRDTGVDFENGKLDLSTLFEDTTNENTAFDNNIISMGGEPRNRENIILFTVASELGSTYVHLLEAGFTEKESKQMVISIYYQRIAESYQRTFGKPFPESMPGEVTPQENLALRTIHDLLPGKIKVENRWISTLDPFLNGITLDERELKQKSSKLDGKFDAEFLSIMICFPPELVICINVNLLDADRSFGDQFGVEESFDELLEEIKDGIYDENDRATFHIRNLMAKGQNFD